MLGANGIGEREYSFSIVQLFVMLGMLGTLNYGNMEIGKVQKNKKETLEKFVPIFLNQLLGCFSSLILYFIFISIFIDSAVDIFLIQSIYIFAAAFDISWYFQGREEFGKTIKRGITSKILGTILTFVLVKDSNDVLIYVLILGISNFIGIIQMWSYFVKEFKWKLDLKHVKNILTKEDFIDHFKNSVSLFLPVIGMQVYSVMDRTILGFTSGNIETGYYANSVKIVRIPMYMVTSLGVVMLPRISYEIKNNNYDKIFYYLRNSVKLMLFISIPLVFGIIGISKNFVPWFFGAEFNKLTILLPILSIMIIPRAITNILGIQLLVPSKKNREYTISIGMGAIFSVILNFLFTPFFNSVATVIISIVSESIVMIFMIIYTKEYKSIFFEIDLIKYLVSGIIMFYIINLLNLLTLNPIIITLIQVVIGIIIYALSCLLFKCSIFIDLNNISKMIKKPKKTIS